MKKIVFYGYLGILISFLVLANTVFATPGIPHQFKGTATVNGGPAPNGTIVSAVIEGSTYTTATANGVYGSAPIPPFFVQDPNNNRQGKTIQFFVEGTQVATFVFENGEFSELNLSATIALPSPGPEGGTGGGNGGVTGGGGGAGGNNTQTNLLTLDKTTALVGEEVTASAKCLWDFGCTLLIDGIEVKNLVYSLAWQDFTTSFETAGEKVFELFRKGTGDTLLGTKTLTVITLEAQQEQINEEENTQGQLNLCEGVNCNDNNFCTDDACSEGECIFNQKADGTSCAGGQCVDGICISTPSQNPVTATTTPIGFFGLGQGAPLGIALILFAAIITAFGVYNMKKRKKATKKQTR